MKGKIIGKKSIVNGLFIVLILMLIFVPSAKALMIEGLMEIGLFKPEISVKKLTVEADLSQVKFKDAKGKVVSLGDFKGKVVFLNFWATWCPPCLAEMPSVNKLYAQFKDDEVVFLLIDADDNLPKAQAYMDRKNYKMPIYSFASDMPANIFNRVLPTTLVFDKQGRLSYKAEGAANYSSKKFVAFINELKNLKE